MTEDKKKHFLDNLPCIDKNNFRIYHDPDYVPNANTKSGYKCSKPARMREPIIREDGHIGKIYNEQKPQLWIKAAVDKRSRINESSSQTLTSQAKKPRSGCMAR